MDFDGIMGRLFELFQRIQSRFRFFGVGLLIFTILFYIFIVYLARVRMRILYLTRVRLQEEKDDKDEKNDDQDEDGDRPLDFVSRGILC